jgi:hypothetical protein
MTSGITQKASTNGFRLAAILIAMTASWVMADEARFVGVLDFRPAEPGNAPPGQTPTAGPIVLRKSVPNGPIIARDLQLHNLVARETGYEEDGAVVFTHDSAGWSMVKTKDGRAGWVNDKVVGGRFVPLETMLDADLASVSESWDRRLYDAPARHPIVWEKSHAAKPIGLLEISQTILFLRAGQKQGFWRVHAASSDNSAVIAEYPFSDITHFRRLEGACPCGLIVLNQQKNWYELGLLEFEAKPVRTAEDLISRKPLPMRQGWVRVPAEAGQFTPLKDEAAATRMFDQPAGLIAPVPGPRDVRVRNSRWLKGDLWVEVDMMSHNGCEGRPDEPRPIAHGWMPAFLPDGRLAIDVATRGC